MTGNFAELPRSWITLDPDALKNNFRVLRNLTEGQSLLPMLKANAYGHGDVWCASTLLDEKGLEGFGIATLEEGVRLRKELGAKAAELKLLVFSGACLWSDSKGQLCEKFKLTPVLSSIQDWERFVAGGWYKRLSYELKWNTGMNRLGIPWEEKSRVRERIARDFPDYAPVGLCSHYAESEKPDSPLTRKQTERFKAIASELSSLREKMSIHMGNSAAIWNLRKLGLHKFSDRVRPGVSIYGIPPWPKAPARALTPVMTWEALLIQTQATKRGDRIGYGGRYKVSEAREKIGILSVGYADGLHRALSQKGQVSLNQKILPVIGTVSMDLTAVRLPKNYTDEGSLQVVELIGKKVTAWKQAELAGTIPYEIFTRIGDRVARRFSPEIKK